MIAVVATVAIAIATPIVLVVNGLRVVANPWFVKAEYGREGFPPDAYGLDTPERTDLALIGLRSIRPGGRGVELLEEATLPDGAPAFDQREISHMADVRRVFGAALRVQLIAGLAILVAAVGLARTRWRRVVPRGLLAGAATTLGVAVLLVPVILLGFDTFFVRFHEVFFEGDSWRFSNVDTLLRLYHEQLWVDVARLVAALTVVQVLLVGIGSYVVLRRLPQEVQP